MGTNTGRMIRVSQAVLVCRGRVIRWILTVAAGTVVAGLILAAPVRADDASFLNEVGLNGTYTEDGKSLWWGHAICTDLQAGVSVRAIYQNVAKQTRAQRTVGFMNSAVSNLCPEQMPTLQAGLGAL